MLSALAGILGTASVSYLAGELLGDHLLLRFVPKFGGAAYQRLQDKKKKARVDDLRRRLEELEQ